MSQRVCPVLCIVCCCVGSVDDDVSNSYFYFGTPVITVSFWAIMCRQRWPWSEVHQSQMLFFKTYLHSLLKNKRLLVTRVCKIPTTMLRKSHQGLLLVVPQSSPAQVGGVFSLQLGHGCRAQTCFWENKRLVSSLLSQTNVCLLQLLSVNELLFRGGRFWWTDACRRIWLGWSWFSFCRVSGSEDT